MITDENNVMFMMTDDAEVHPGYDIGVWVNTEYFASTLSQMFNRIWETIKVKS